MGNTFLSTCKNDLYLFYISINAFSLWIWEQIRNVPTHPKLRVSLKSANGSNSANEALTALTKH
jgi:hypothetical protein